jgi:hypothetical protein
VEDGKRPRADVVQSYFDIDTKTVLKRVGISMIPRDNFVAEVCEGQIDLYGESIIGLGVKYESHYIELYSRVGIYR